MARERSFWWINRHIYDKRSTLIIIRNSSSIHVSVLALIMDVSEHARPDIHLFSRHVWPSDVHVKEMNEHLVGRCVRGPGSNCRASWSAFVNSHLTGIVMQENSRMVSRSVELFDVSNCCDTLSIFTFLDPGQYVTVNWNRVKCQAIRFAWGLISWLPGCIILVSEHDKQVCSHPPSSILIFKSQFCSKSQLPMLQLPEFIHVSNRHRDVDLEDLFAFQTGQPSVWPQIHLLKLWKGITDWVA